MGVSGQSASTVDDITEPGKWSTSLKATQDQLKRTRLRLEQYQAALRLANVEIKRRNRGIIALTTFAYQANRAANSAMLLKLALMQALETTGSHVGAVVLVDANTKELTLRVHKGLTIELERILTGQQLEQGALALMPHLVSGLGALFELNVDSDTLEQNLLQASNLTSLASLPLQVEQKVLGALLVGLQDERTFTSAELSFLMALSQQAAIALESLRLREGLWNTAEKLFDEEQMGINLNVTDNSSVDLGLATPFDLPDATATMAPQSSDNDIEQVLNAVVETENEVRQHNSDLQTLNAIAEQMNRTLNLKEILQAAVNQTQAVLNVDAAWIYLIDEQNQLELKVHTGLSTAYVRGMHRLMPKDGLEGRVYLENQPHFAEAILKEKYPYKIWVDKEGLQAIGAVPITRPDFQKSSDGTISHVIGVLAAGTIASGPRVWNTREMRLLESIANHVAPAIDNAQLYEKLQEKEAELRAGNQVLQEINHMLSAENALFTEFMEGHLDTGLKNGTALLRKLLAQAEESANESARQHVQELMEIINQLGEMSKWVIRNT